MWAFAVIVTLSLRILSVLANVEKTIFLGPEAIHIPRAHPNLEDLHLEVLTPSHWRLRSRILATFPHPTSPKGTETWVLLNGLEQDQRYEVRVCWAATVSCTCQSHDNPMLFDGILVIGVTAFSFILIIQYQLATNSFYSQHVYAA